MTNRTVVRCRQYRQEAGGQVEEEVPRHGLLEAVPAQAAVEEAVDHGIAD